MAYTNYKRRKKIVTYVPKVSQQVTKDKYKSEETEFVNSTPEEWFNDGNAANKLPLESDEYFKSYSWLGIHKLMIKDKIRTDSYQAACMKNADFIKDKIVLDVGCGTGILSIFAARAGAKHVYAVDNSNVAYYASEIIKANKLDSVISIIKGKIEEVILPVDKVDIIISEWMGHFLLYESMLDSVIYARDKYLKPDGVLMPDRVRSNLAAMTGIDENQKSADFWKDVYGVDMSIMKDVVMAEPAIDKGNSKDIVSNSFSYFDIDLYKVKVSDLEFANKYSLICSKDAKVMSLISWFDVAFEKVPNKIVFTTSPFTTGTHWMQTIFFLREPIDCKEKDVISGTIAVTKNKREKRDIDIVFTIHHLEETRRKYLYKLIYV